MKLPELLSPAGSMEALAAAVDGGADAVYARLPNTKLVVWSYFSPAFSTAVGKLG